MGTVQGRTMKSEIWEFSCVEHRMALLVGQQNDFLWSLPPLSTLPFPCTSTIHSESLPSILPSGSLYQFHIPVNYIHAIATVFYNVMTSIMYHNVNIAYSCE